MSLRRRRRSLRLQLWIMLITVIRAILRDNHSQRQFHNFLPLGT